MSEHEQGTAPGREHSNETSNAERAGRETGERGAAGRHGGERGGGGGRRGRRGGGHASQQSQRPQGREQRRTDSSLNMDELRELTELFTTHGLTDFEFENADIRVRLSRNPAPQTGAHAGAPLPHGFQTPSATLSHAGAAPTAVGAAPTPATAAPATEAPPAEEKAEDLQIVISPIVGTFYRSPSPEAEPFVRVGSAVEPDTVVCIIEAMKLMNEIHSETTGTIEKIYVENGQPVEYGQPLFGVKK